MFVGKYPSVRTVQLANLVESKLAAYIAWIQKAIPFIDADVSLAFEFRFVSNTIEQANCPTALKQITWLWKTYFLTIAIDVKFFEYTLQTYVKVLGYVIETTYQSAYRTWSVNCVCEGLGSDLLVNSTVNWRATLVACQLTVESGIYHHYVQTRCEKCNLNLSFVGHPLIMSWN